MRSRRILAIAVLLLGFSAVFIEAQDKQPKDSGRAREKDKESKKEPVRRRSRSDKKKDNRARNKTID